MELLLLWVKEVEDQQEKELKEDLIQGGQDAVHSLMLRNIPCVAKVGRAQDQNLGETEETILQLVWCCTFYNIFDLDIFSGMCLLLG